MALGQEKSARTGKLGEAEKFCSLNLNLANRLLNFPRLAIDNNKFIPVSGPIK